MSDGAPTDSSTLTHILCGNPLSRAICCEISDACHHGGCQGGESVARRATGAAPACGGEGVSETGAAPACGNGRVYETRPAPACGGEGVSETGAAPACGNGRVYETRPAPACGDGGVSETGAAPACGDGGDNETGAAPASRESPDIGVSLEAGVVWVSCCAREGVAGVVWVSCCAREGVAGVVWVSCCAREGVAGGGLGFVLCPRRRGRGWSGFRAAPEKAWQGVVWVPCSARRGGVVQRSAAGAQGELPRPQLLSGVTGRSREGACCIRVDSGDGRETRETRSHVVNLSPRPVGTGKATFRSSHQ